MPLSCSFAEQVMSLIEKEYDDISKEIERVRFMLDEEERMGEYADFVLTRHKERLTKLEQHLDTIEGYKNLIQRETCEDI
jgi:hypothetical protein